MSIALVSGLAQGFAAQAAPAPGALVSLPFSRGGRIFTSRVAAGGGVDFCVQDGPTATPRIVVEAKEAPLDTAYPLTDFSLSADGRLCAYFVTQPDSRFEEIRIVDVDTGKRLPDTIRWTHFGDFCWEKGGFFYGAFSAPRGDADPYQNERVFFHRRGDAQKSDLIAYEDTGNPHRGYLFLTTFDHRYLLLHKLERVNGKLLSSEWFRRDDRPTGPFIPLQGEMAEGRFFLGDNRGDRLIYFTRYRSPKGRVIEVNARHPEESRWKTLIPEPVDDCDSFLGRLAVLRAQTGGGNRAFLYSLDGKLESEIPAPPGSTIDVQFGQRRDRYGFVSIEQKGVKRYFLYDPKARKLLPFR